MNKKINLNETLDKIRSNSGLTNNPFTLNEVLKGTKLYSNYDFIAESLNRLNSSSENEFLTYLYESADKFSALTEICVLTFSNENSKLGGDVTTFSLPAGWTCPFASQCLKKVSRDRVIDPEKAGTSKISKRTGKEVPYKGDVEVTKGEDSQFDCFAANQEMQYDAVRANRWHNYDLLEAAYGENGVQGQADLIIRSLKFHFDNERKTKEVRIHESGDFYSGKYLEAWMEVAKKMPDIHFYAYTKSVPLVKQREEEINSIPNFSLTLSVGGKKDSMLGDVNVKQAKVFESPEEILKSGLILDLDDNLAKEKGGKESNFALLLHGTQEAGEKSQMKLRNETFAAYWKYRGFLNRSFNLPESTRMATDYAKEALEYIKELEKDPIKSKKIPNLDFIQKLLRYTIKYNSYGFSDDLVNILPEKYRP
jgi:hypothetical protein